MSQKITIIKCNKSQKGTLNHQNRTGQQTISASRYPLEYNELRHMSAG
jgi:hypothetical protein